MLRREEEFIRRQDGDGDGDAGGKEGEENQSGGGWITSKTTCRRDNCQGRKLKTEVSGGVS